ncbi:TVG0555376 [Thermoplasma volcanium GSS1]|uniref:TVG0555376 protein n=1 Tax=Thermoplasma volcanium (strain ATCC 51530 / DSM 4299 / JCM 9571 / NBRC 15438 / GSS1) TaxID=273116 RepID=Q97B90_THEVO|nr:hypothetical protein [Thermoplasma volcanium]BAB59709.1 TVG0555376 [Thermoplasma volcanium GSS1]
MAQSEISKREKGRALITVANNVAGFNLWKRLVEEGYDVDAILPSEDKYNLLLSELVSRKNKKYDFIVNTVDRHDYAVVTNKMLKWLYPTEKIIFISSDLVYEPRPGKKKENDNAYPPTMEGKYFLEAESALDVNSDLVLRVGLVTGRCVPNILTNTINLSRANMSIDLSGAVVRNFISNADLSEYIIRLLDKNGIYNASAKSMTPRDFALELCAKINVNCKLRRTTDDKVFDYSMDTTKIELTTGYYTKDIFANISSGLYLLG